MRSSAFSVLILAALCSAPAAFSQSSPAAAPAAPDATAISEQVANAEALIVKSDWKGAESLLTPYLSAHPDDARALFDAGYLADAQNQPGSAADLYRRALAADPKAFEPQLSLGLLLARQGKEDEARPELIKATALDPGDAGPALKARAWRALAKIDRVAFPIAASNDLIEALKLTPETAADTLLAASLAEAAGQLDTAEAAYRRMLGKDPGSAQANAGLAHILMSRKQYPEAETLLRAALQSAPDDLALSAQLATALAGQDKAEALPLLQKLHDAHPAETAITRMLAQVLAEAGDDAAADQLFAQLLAAHPDDSALLAAHGNSLTRQLKYAEAFAAFDKATRLDPANADAWSGLAFAASRTNQPNVTLHALTMRSNYLPEVPATYFLWATAYDTLHDKATAATYYQHFLDAAAGKFPDQEWQARQRLILLRKTP